MAIELSYEELDSYIQQICTRRKLFHIENKEGKRVPLLIMYPTQEDNFLAEVVYKEALRKAEEEGLPSLAEMEELIKKRGIFTEADEKKIEALKSKMAGQRAVLAKTTRVPARRDRLKEVISNIQSEIDAIQYKREVSLEMSRERKATEEKFLFLTRRCAYDPLNQKLFWETETDFQKEPDFVFRKRVFIESIVMFHGIKQEIVRYIARSNLWRIRYVTAVKTSESLFGLSISEYTVDQLTLMYWSHFYQSIYEMMPSDRPSDQIIEDDQALDAYMKDWQADRNRDAVASRSSSKYGNKSAWDYQEQLVMRSNPVHQDIEYSETLTEKTNKQTNGKPATVNAAPIGRNQKAKNPLSRKR